MGGKVDKTVIKSTSFLVYGTAHSISFHGSISEHPNIQRAEKKNVKKIDFSELQDLIRKKTNNESFTILSYEILRREEQQRINEERRKIYEQQRQLEDERKRKEKEIEMEKRRIFFNDNELEIKT